MSLDNQRVIAIHTFSQRPDSFPMMSAVNDLKRNTDGALSFDSVITTMYGPSQFYYTMVGENSK